MILVGILKTKMMCMLSDFSYVLIIIPLQCIVRYMSLYRIFHLDVQVIGFMFLSQFREFS
jgi:hypothetical protein